MALIIDDTTMGLMLAEIEASIGPGPILQLRTGAPSGLSVVGSLLAEIQLPSNWLADPAARAVAKSGSWRIEEAQASGTAGHFLLRQADIGNTVKMAGAVTNLAGAGPLKLSSLVIVEGSPVEITSFTLTAGNAP
jgi:hypothetical protein